MPRKAPENRSTPPGDGAAHRLVGDIGGTNARFAVATKGVVGEMTILPTRDYPTFEAAVRAYLETCADRGRITEAGFAIAGPVIGDRIQFTNRAWQFSIAELQARLGLRRLTVVNDFAANALALPYLQPADVEQVGKGVAVPGRPIGVLGPGTGLGVAGLIPTDAGWLPLSGEGGHTTLPAASARESRIIDKLRETHGHVSAERVLSGDGLLGLYGALAVVEGAKPVARTAADVTDGALKGTDPLAGQATEMFCAILGTVAGNLALTLGAQGGIYIAGGIVPRLGAYFARSPFRARFEDRGRFKAYLATIPTFVAVHKALAMVGLANLR